jgi:hypothetical protein
MGTLLDIARKIKIPERQTGKLILLEEQSNVQDCGTLIEDVVNMPLDTFAKANLIVKVASKILGEDILFVSNDEIAKKLKDEGFVVYTGQELKTIVRLNPDMEALKRIHEVKQVFSGSKVVQ